MKLKKAIYNILVCILSTIIAICIFTIASKKYNYYKDNKNYETLKESYENIMEEDSEGNGEEISLDDNFKKINPDYKLWITIENTVIDYPVVQGEDNDFYLNHNFYREESVSGTIFIDNRNNINEDRSLVLYGHNMKNGTMFTDINKFKDKDFFDNGIIKVIKGDKEYIYEVFSVFIEEANSISLKYKFGSNDEFNEYINNIKEKSIYTKEVENYSNIITLYTCSYEFENARTIVCAVEKNK